jgi:hypothetical protein
MKYDEDVKFMNIAASRVLLAFAIGAAALAAQPPRSTADFRNSVQPCFAKSCYGCHNSKLKVGGFDIEVFQTADSVTRDRPAGRQFYKSWNSGWCRPRELCNPTRRP